MELDDPKKKLSTELMNGTRWSQEKIKNGLKKWNWTIPRKNLERNYGTGRPQGKIKNEIRNGTRRPREKLRTELRNGTRTTPQGSVTQEYAPIGGEADFCRESAKLAFGDTSPVITNGLNVTVQVT